jgi:hypothetical protein
VASQYTAVGSRIQVYFHKIRIGRRFQMQTPVNIVYPIDGASYPIVDIAPPGRVASAYFTASFGTTCSGGPHRVEWGFDESTVGQGTFYDQMSVQFVHKLPAGAHTLWVASDCGKNIVKFEIG